VVDALWPGNREARICRRTVGGRGIRRLLQSDSHSFLHAEPPFVPSLGATPGQFTMVDLLTFAGVGGRR
jgi:hypothetical protein